MTLAIPWNVLLGISQAVMPGVVTLIGIWVKARMHQRAKPDLSRTITRNEKVKPILEQILVELRATRCCEWAVSNGDITLSGYHLQKLSILTEAVKDGIEPIQALFQLVPISQFNRAIEGLRNSPFVVSHESKMQDDLAALNLNYDVVTVAEVCIRGEFNKWTGILRVAWDVERDVSEREIAFLKLQAARIGAIKN